MVRARGRMSAFAVLSALCAATSPVRSQQASPALTRDAVVVIGHHDNAIGTSDAASQGSVDSKLIEERPALRPGEVLEFVPGVIVTQHSGDGKANQYFLRGFNLDHGTDFATFVAGMPVNMRSHAHGQGYTDLNFLIPELVSRINYRKGPYFAEDGDFASAGSARCSGATLAGARSPRTTRSARSRRAWYIFASASRSIRPFAWHWTCSTSSTGKLTTSPISTPRASQANPLRA